MELMNVSDLVPIKPDDIIIQVAYVGICGTDIHCYKGQYDRLVTPIILGHEFSGVVHAVGTGVKKVKIGDRVTSETTYTTCGTCQHCLEKEYNLCSNRKGIGTQVDGAFAQYVRTREESVHLLDESISLLDAALSEPLACGVHSTYEKAQVKENNVCIVIGPGPIGMSVAQALKSLKAKVILVGLDKDIDKLNMAKDFGVDLTINIDKEDTKKIVMEFTHGIGADYCFECSGSEHALPTIFDSLRNKGKLIQLGVFSESFNSIDMNSIVQRELQVIGSRSQKPSSWITTLDLMKKKSINASKLVTEVLPLEKWYEAFELAGSNEHVKVLIQPNKELM